MRTPFHVPYQSTLGDFGEFPDPLFCKPASVTQARSYAACFSWMYTSQIGTDFDLMFGVLALQAGLIDPNQFVEACALWSTSHDPPIARFLIERGWISPADQQHLEYLLERKLQKVGGDPAAALAETDDTTKRCLATLTHPEIQEALATLKPAHDQAQAASMIELVPRNRERYFLSRLHATGGIGRVWVAHDADLGRDVALKELRPECATDKGLWRRFLREARVTGQLEHPGIVPVYELALRPSDRQPFYTMRFVSGKTLAEMTRDYHRNRAAGRSDSLPFLNLLSAFVTVCNTVAYAHSRGVVHRDLKGQNVVVGDFGEVVVLDWGMAKVLSDEAIVEPTSVVYDEDAALELTVQGQAVGTPAYMAPEQAAGRPDLIDVRTDVYGLGAILYEVLTGRAPFEGSSTREILQRVRQEEPVTPHDLWSDVPPALETACLRAMSKNAADRYESPSELAQEVQNWQEVQRRHAEEQRDTFFQLSIDMLCTAGFDGYFKRLNPAWERTLGYTTQELLARPYLDFVHPEDRASTVAEAGNIASGAEVIYFENRYRCKDGSYRWLQWVAKPFAEQKLIFCTARDVTEQRRAAEALRESEERYRSVVAAIDEGIIVFDAGGAIRASNTSAERILGVSADQMMGRTPLDPRWRTIHEDGSPFPGELLPASVTLRTGQACTNVVLGVHKPEGTLTWISVNSRPLLRADGATLYGVMTSFSDITGFKLTEAALARANERLKAAGHA